MRLKKISSENVAQRLARIGQFLSAETDSKDQASDANAIQLPEDPVRKHSYTVRIDGYI